jgi:DNA-binding MarR family transcriptional regulator
MDAVTGQLHDLLMDLVRTVGAVQQAIAGQPLTLSQVFALHEIDCRAGLSQRDLADRLRLEKSSISRMVADMEARGLLIKERDPANRRFYRLRLTDRGRALHANTANAFHQEFERLTAAMSRSERAALVTGLTALVRPLRAGS